MENRAEARFCDRCGASLSNEDSLERRGLVTLLFCDLSGSTALGEHVDPESVRGLIFRYFQEMRGAIERHGGTVEKFIGDAVMAVFGVPRAHEDDALRAVRASVEMSERLAALNEELERRFGVRVAIRIGLNSGEVVSGGTSDREAIVTGDAVNVAARLEQAAQAGEILLGVQTYQLVRDAVLVEPVAPLTLKGKAKPVPAYRLVDLVPGAVPTRPVEMPLVSRQPELDLLQETFARVVSQRSCRIVTVLGEPGVGKSRLAAELAAVVAPEATILSGRCLSYGEAITFWPVAEIVRQAASIGEDDTREEARAKLASLLADADDPVLVAARVGQAIGLVEDTASLDEIAWAVRKLFEFLARTRPIILLLDNLQWGEPVLLDLLADLPGLVRGAPILLVCLARPELVERRPDWQVTLQLEPLETLDVVRLVRNLVGEAAINSAACERIAQAAGGNPLFVEQLVAMLIDDGLLRNEDGLWALRDDAGELAIPPTIRALLGARLDGLAPSERGALERGSIEGELFHRGAVAALSPAVERARIGEQLQTLVDRDLIQMAQANFADETAFRFRHILVRDVSYQGTSKKRRAQLHERFARWLTRRVGERLSEYEEILGYHLERAFRYREELGPVDPRGRELARRASDRLAASARRARARGDMPAAANLLERATSLLPSADLTRRELLVELGSALREAGELARADAVLVEAIDAAAATADRRIESRARLHRLRLLSLTDPEGRSGELLAAAEEAISLFGELGDHADLATAWMAIGDVHQIAGRYGATVEACERALTHARSAGNEQQVAEIQVRILLSALFGAVPATDVARLCEQFRSAEMGGRAFEPLLLTVLAATEALQGRIDEARALVQRARRLAEELGLWGRLVGVSLVSCYVELLGDDPVAAEREGSWGYELAKRAGEKGVRSTIAGHLAEALYAQGRYEEAERFNETSRDTGASDDISTQIIWRKTQAKILARQKHTEAAERLAREAVAFAEPTDVINTHGDALVGLAEVLRLAGRPHETVLPLQQALALYEQKGDLVSAGKARALLKELQRTTSVSP
jgi:class 3 adenylate cyclase/predicted ATPase